MLRKWTWFILVCVPIIFSQSSRAQSWQATVGAQSSDKGLQALAFLPTEIWIHAGDSITWTFGTDELHTVTFLAPMQVRPTYSAGCPDTNTTPDGSAFDGSASACVNSGVIRTVGTTYTVTFPDAGNYKLVCLVHANQNGVVHVLAPSDPLPHNQDFYDRQAAIQRHDLLSDRDNESSNHEDRGKKSEERHDHDFDEGHAHHHVIVTGTGELVSTPGGIQSVSLMRFLRPDITIHAGQTVEWASSDVSGHTVTFGQEPPNVTPETPKSANVFTDSDGALHAIINSSADNVHSGRIAPAPQDRSNLAQSAPGITRFRVTFMNPGAYPYICAFHDDLGMTGNVIVLP